MSTQRTIQMHQRRTNEEVVDAYKATGSVWRAGKRLGLTGQQVHARLKALGYPLAAAKWTEEEVKELRDLVDHGVRLGEIAERLGRPYAGIAGKASELGIRSKQGGVRKLPRGAGWDKVSTLRHMKALELFSGKMTQYARSNGLSLELFIRAMQLHCPERYEAYVGSHSDLPQKTCPYCSTVFVPFNSKQAHCSRKCAADARTDANYFGGKRRTTIGLAEGLCQVCGRTSAKRLSSHHVFGKENDPDNESLVALCSGCHNVVTLLGNRSFDNTAWESLVSLVWLRKHGPEIAAGGLLGDLRVYVEIDLEPSEDEEGGAA